MYCPYCRYTSFDHLPVCPKCNYDWSKMRERFGLDAPVVPPNIQNEMPARKEKTDSTNALSKYLISEP